MMSLTVEMLLAAAAASSAGFEGITPPVPLCGAGRMPSNQRVWTKFSIFHLYQSEQRC